MSSGCFKLSKSTTHVADLMIFVGRPQQIFDCGILGSRRISKIRSPLYEAAGNSNIGWLNIDRKTNNILTIYAHIKLSNLDDVTSDASSLDINERFLLVLVQ